MKIIKITSYSLEDTKKIAISLITGLDHHDTICLYGDVGLGKTTFCKYLIHAITDLPLDDIVSPTFPIICSYPLLDDEIYHIDLYRVEHKQELIALGITEIINHHLCLIEWAEKLPEDYLKDAIAIHLTQDKNDHRIFTIMIPTKKFHRFIALKNYD